MLTSEDADKFTKAFLSRHSVGFSNLVPRPVAILGCGNILGRSGSDPDMNTWDDETFEKFCNQADFDMNHPEVKEIGSRIWSFIKELAGFIGRENSLFKNSIVRSGSFYEDLKSESPDEFDFMICLEDLSKPGVCRKKEIPLRPVRDPGYVDVQVTSEDHQRRWRRYISRQGNLKPDTLLTEFQKLIKIALTKMNPAEGDKLKWNTHGIDVHLRKIPVTMTLTWNGKKYRNFEIDIDLTLCIEMAGWPVASDIEKRVTRDDPRYEVIRKVMSAGHHLVASTIGESGKRRPCWRLSFSAAEGIILKEICKDPNLIHRKTLKVLKVLRKKNEDDLCLLERSLDQEEYSPLRQSYIMITWALSSYVLKTMFLQEWFENPEDSKWRKDQIRKRATGILQRVEESVSRKDIRSFWVPDYKLFNFRARNATQIGRASSKLLSIRLSLTETEKETSEDESPESHISRLFGRVKVR